jgi:AraC-like DNA-binding protein
VNNLKPFVRFVNKTGFFIPEHTIIANDCHVLYNLKDVLIFKIQGKQHILTPHSLIYYPYGEPYSISASSQNILFYTVNFDFTQEFSSITTPLRPQILDNYNIRNNLASIPPELSIVFGNPIYIENAVNLEKYFEDLYKEAINRRLNWSSIRDDLMGIILSKIHRKEVTSPSTKPICDEIKKLIELDSTVISNQQIAETLGYHPNYLNDIFKRSEGLTIHQYVLQKKLSRACELISTTNIPYETIADLCGFSSTAHLCVTIKKKYNLTPSEIRRQF